MRTLRVLPWSLLVTLFVFAAATWGSLPDEVPMRLNAAGEAVSTVAKTYLSWFGLPLIALGTHLLLFWIGRLLPAHPHLFNHPEKERFLKLPPSWRAPVIVEMQGLLDLTSVAAMVTMLIVQWSLWQTARGTPSAYAIPLVILSAVSITPMVLIYSSRIGTAIDAANKRWQAAGSPAA
jgi:uncharacterized membrane protein